GIVLTANSAQYDPQCPNGNTFDCVVAKPKSTSVRIRNNTLSSIGGDGVLMVLTDGAIAEYNSVGNWALTSRAASGIWSAASLNAQIQHNEVFGAHVAGIDRTAFDIDWGNISTYISYNYSHDNYGGMLLVWEVNDPTPGSGAQSTYIDDSIVRFNISK